MTRFVWDILSFNFCLEIYEKSYQISEIETVITFERNQILTFCKKQWFKLIAIFDNNQTSFFDPWPPLLPWKFMNNRNLANFLRFEVP